MVLSITAANDIVDYMDKGDEKALEALKQHRQDFPSEFYDAMTWLFEYEPEQFAIMDELTKP